MDDDSTCVYCEHAADEHGSSGCEHFDSDGAGLGWFCSCSMSRSTLMFWDDDRGDE